MLAALGLGGGRGGSRACRVRSRRGRPGTSPVRSAAAQVIAAGIPAAAAAGPGKGVPPGQNQAGPLHV